MSRQLASGQTGKAVGLLARWEHQVGRQVLSMLVLGLFGGVTPRPSRRKSGLASDSECE